MQNLPALFMFLAAVVIVAYLINHHRQLNAPPPGQSPMPDYPGMPISASAMPGDMVGPGATGNSGWYLPPPSAAEVELLRTTS